MCCNEYAVEVNEVSKTFQIYDNPKDRLKQAIIPKIKNVIGKDASNYYDEFSALENVSFQIKKGETVGIVGRNGSGKSTILQIICGTLSPSSGDVKTNGRIAALLELGSGFNPEFSGRENVYMNAAILGLSRRETAERFGDIEAFADIGDFIDQPVKSYSSGMVVRLAFAVAINVEPEILVIDEALSVGDELFQRKCFSKIEEIKSNGATILFVSHSGPAVIELCDRAILMDSGEKLIEGKSKEVIGHYQKLLYAPDDKKNEIRSEIVKTDTKLELNSDETEKLVSIDEEYFDENLKPSSTIEYQSNGAVICSAEIKSCSNRRVNHLLPRVEYKYRYQVKFTKTVKNVRFGMLIKTMSGVELGGAHTANNIQDGIPVVEAGEILDIEFMFNCNLNPGTYFMNSGVTGTIDGVDTFLHRLLDIEMFRVLPDSRNLTTAIVDFGCTSKIVSRK